MTWVVGEDLERAGADDAGPVDGLDHPVTQRQVGPEPDGRPAGTVRCSSWATSAASYRTRGGFDRYQILGHHRGMDPELLTTLKALSDASRLRIVGLLAARSYAVAELADDLSLSPGTVVHHLKRLKAAGLVEAKASHPYVEYSLRLDRLQAVGRLLDEIEHADEEQTSLPGPAGEALPAFDAKVLRSFMEGDRLASIPAQEKKRLVVLPTCASAASRKIASTRRRRSTSGWPSSIRTWRRSGAT